MTMNADQPRDPEKSPSLPTESVPQQPGSSVWLRRVIGLVRKELLQIRRDPSSYLIAGVLPLLLLFIFGYGVSLDLRRVPIAVVVEQATPESDSLLVSFRNSRFFEVRLARHRAQMEDALVAGQVKGVVVLAADFSERLGRGDTAPVQIIVDGSDPNTAGLVPTMPRGFLPIGLLRKRFRALIWSPEPARSRWLSRSRATGSTPRFAARTS